MKQEIGIRKIAGKKIFCIFSEPDDVKEKKLVIMCHGFRGSHLGDARTFVWLERALVQHGFSVLRFDQPNCGNSEGDFSEVSFEAWIEVTIALIKRYSTEGYLVGLYGQSMGATLSIVAATNSYVQTIVRGLVLWVPDPKQYDLTINVVGYNDFTREEGGQIYPNKFWKEVEKADFNRCLQNYTGEVEIVYGATDEYVAERDRNAVIVNAVTQGHKVMVLKGEGHSKWQYKKVADLFEKHIKFFQEVLKV